MALSNLEESVIWDKSDAYAQAMAILNEVDILILGTHEYKVATKWVSTVIDKRGPEEALEQIKYATLYLSGQIYQMSM